MSSRRAKREHRFAAENLSAYVDGQLTATARQRVDAHLLVCKGCQVDLATLQQTKLLLRQTPQVRLPRSFALPASAVREQRRHRIWNSGFVALRGVSVALSVALVALVSVSALQPGQPLMAARGGSAEMAHVPEQAPAVFMAAENVEEASPGERDSVPPQVAQSAADAPAQPQAVAVAEAPQEAVEAAPPAPNAPVADSVGTAEEPASEGDTPELTAASAPLTAAAAKGGGGESDKDSDAQREAPAAPAVVATATPLPAPTLEPTPEQKDTAVPTLAPQVVADAQPEQAPEPQAEYGVLVDSGGNRLSDRLRFSFSIVLGLLLMAMAGMIWSGHKRRA